MERREAPTIPRPPPVGKGVLPFNVVHQGDPEGVNRMDPHREEILVGDLPPNVRQVEDREGSIHLKGSCEKKHQRLIIGLHHRGRVSLRRIDRLIHPIGLQWQRLIIGVQKGDLQTLEFHHGSIASFQDLCDKFISQYYGNKRPAKDISSLFTMKQHEDERLQAFLTRFNLVKSMVMECHPSTAIQVFKLAMNRGTPFHTSLVVNTPKTIDELNERADDFVRLEEEEAANARKTSIISTKEKSKAKIRQKQAQPHCQTSWKAEKRPREEEAITPLRVTLARLNLRRQVEMLIAKGEFAGYVQGPAQEQNRPTEQTAKLEELLRTRQRQAQMKRRIGSVHALHQQNASAQKMFDRTNLFRVQTSHEDPLVVRSSANVMPKVTFDQLEIKPKRLKPTGNPLLGFARKWVEPIGMVELIVQAAERVLTETFVVIEIHPSYNLLMGRGWIHRVQGVPSTLHQVMRCLGPDRNKVIDIHGDQVTAKEYYSVTLKSAAKGKAPIHSTNPR
ncbi:uncharacterized protein LOC132286452 [Cornus florida]|uniref:uncharacterized protein LOC132286452 n=1 Tax=Cornus florida TaxID=4283 RepID=UPI0028987E17|nr:uncharacterized protein LOC132286452 [Cornus florida]